MKCRSRWGRDSSELESSDGAGSHISTEGAKLSRMKKATSRNRGSAAKRKVPPKTVDEYLVGVPEPARSTLEKVRAVIRSVAPAEAVELISYRIPMFKYKGMLVGFAAFSNHCSLFPGALPESFKDELKQYRTAKGTIQFPVDKPLPAALVKKLVKARIEQNERKSKR
jgi:uncharacterized protein YdhG (YjbR/CyaY superfamily)